VNVLNDVLYWIGVLLYLYGFVLLARMVMSWVVVLLDYRPTGAAAVAFEFVYTVTDPPLRFLQRFIPSPRIGNVPVDLSFIVLALGIYIVSRQLMGA
jgi:YggT family protein